MCLFVLIVCVCVCVHTSQHVFIKHHQTPIFRSWFQYRLGMLNLCKTFHSQEILLKSQWYLQSSLLAHSKWVYSCSLSAQSLNETSFKKNIEFSHNFCLMQNVRHIWMDKRALGEKKKMLPITLARFPGVALVLRENPLYFRLKKSTHWKILLFRWLALAWGK